MKRFLKVILLAINIVFALALGLSYFSPHVDPAENFLFSIFGLIYPVLLIANLVFIILWLFIDYRAIFLSILTILLGWKYVPSFYTINPVSAPTSQDLNMLSYNVSNGVYYGRHNELVRTDLDAMVRSLAKVKDLDIIAIQEGSSKVETLFHKHMPSYKPVRINDRRAMLFSKLPIIDSGLIDFGEKVNSCVWADINYNGVKIRVYTAHLSSNNVTRSTNKLIETGDMRDRSSWNSLKDLLRRYKNSTIERSRQADMIMHHMDSFNGPIILCGDFNDTPMSYVLHKIQSRLKDSYVEAGSGNSWTFNGTIPLLRIDYILYSDELSANKFSVLNHSFSDHYPIIGSYKLKQTQ